MGGSAESRAPFFAVTGSGFGMRAECGMRSAVFSIRYGARYSGYGSEFGIPAGFGIRPAAFGIPFGIPDSVLDSVFCSGFGIPFRIRYSLTILREQDPVRYGQRALAGLSTIAAIPPMLTGIR